MTADALRRRLEENPLPARALAIMSEYELRLLARNADHEGAAAEIERRRARRRAKATGDLVTLTATAPPRGERGVRDADLRELVSRLFAAEE